MQPHKKPLPMRHVLACLDTHAIPYCYQGDMDICVRATAELHTAGDGDVAWCAAADYADAVSHTRASVVITTAALKPHVAAGVAVIVTDNPRLAYAKIKQSLYPVAPANGEIADTAVVADDVVLADGVQIDAFAVVKSGAVLGAGVIVGAYTLIGDNVCIGDNTHIGSHCHIESAQIGTSCIIQPHVTIGTSGFGFVLDFDNGHCDIPHTGRVVMGDGVVVGAGTCIDKGGESDTIIGEGTRIDNLVHIAHNVKIGKYCVIPGQVGLAGSVTIGDRVMFSGQAGVVDGVHVGDGAVVLMRAVVAKDVQNNQVVSGVPARIHKDNLRRQAKINRYLKE